MRHIARATVLASTAAIAAAMGAVVLAPMASAEPEAPASPFGSSVAESPDLVVTIGTTCVAKDDKKPEGEKVGALEISVENVGKGAASAVSVNYAVLPDVNGAATVEKVDPGKTEKVIVPSGATEWVSRPGGVAVFSPQLDANYSNNVAVGLLSVDCAPAPADTEE
ncbi:Pro-kumamolisin, activation domain family protein [Rhodococcus sp. BP22]|uniref:Pro-kumamolisin, activation domain family protein n=1 Tax=Rhodococcus sp. BP22 TaxID=2758566 RepID=UPI00164409F9|nr:Pro-kumamolisin, activation domain family protein [Rhodococcus sp. BP22]